MANDTVVISAEGHELSLTDLQNALKRYYRQQEMLVSVGRRRKSHATDHLAILIKKDGVTEEGWALSEVRSNYGGSIGETRVALSRGSSGQGIWLCYSACTQELRALPTRISQPVYP